MRHVKVPKVSEYELLNRLSKANGENFNCALAGYLINKKNDLKIAHSCDFANLMPELVAVK